MSDEEFVVIGGNAAGMSAASKAKRENPEMEITVFQEKDVVSFGLCGLPFYIGGVVEDLEDLVVVSKETFREKRDIDVRTNHTVTGIDPDKKIVTGLDGEDNEFEKSYDKLLIATGAHSKTPDIEGMDLDNVFSLHWLEDGRRIKEFVEKNKPEKVAVTAGYIGIEMVEAFLRLGVKPVVVAKYDHVLPRYSPEIIEPMNKELEDRGVEIVSRSKIQEIRGNGEGKVESILTDSGEIEVDFVLMDIGVEPTVEIARDAGIKTGSTGAIEVDERMETNIENVYAAGDCVESEHIISDEKVYEPLGDVANRQGRVAGINVAGGNAEFPGVLGTEITEGLGYTVAKTGLDQDEAKESGFDAISSTITAGSRADYYPGRSKIVIELTVEEGTGRLVGGQMAGKERVAQRINVLASLIYNGNTVDEIQNIDYGYAPPVSPTWDPVQTAAKVASSRLGD